MRILAALLILAVMLAACNGNGDDVVTPAVTPTPTVVATPTEQPAPVEDDGLTPEEDATPTPIEENDDLDAPDHQDLESIVNQVAEQVSELRGLEFLEELNFSLMTQEELRDYIEEESDFDESEINLFWMLRLIDDRELDLQEMLLDMQVEQIQGFYNPETGETYLISDGEELTPLRRVFLAHEIVHALQDQHFDLGRLEEYLPDRDRSMAFRTIVEGDAVLTQELYAQQYLSADEQLEYLREAIGMLQDDGSNQATEQLPRYLVESLTFPYSAGVQFAIRLFDGGFSRINQMLEDPPQSTWQVSNPEAYLDGQIDDPVEVLLPEIGARLGSDWEESLQGTLGTFDLTILLEENGVDSPDDAISGWTGSAYVMFEREGHLLTVLATRWESEEDAIEFLNALIETMAGYSEEDGVWIGDGRYHTIVVNGDSVNLKSSTDPDALVDAAQLD